MAPVRRPVQIPGDMTLPDFWASELGKKGVRLALEPSPAGKTVLVGPVLVYVVADDKWAVALIHGTPGRKSTIDMIEFGDFEPDISDDPLVRGCKSVVWVRRFDSLTETEAGACRDAVIRHLRTLAAEVLLFDSDLELAKAQARIFPSRRSRQMLADLQAEQEQLDAERAA